MNEALLQKRNLKKQQVIGSLVRAKEDMLSLLNFTGKFTPTEKKIFDHVALALDLIHQSIGGKHE